MFLVKKITTNEVFAVGHTSGVTAGNIRLDNVFYPEHEFTLVEVETLPYDFIPFKYRYTDTDGFHLNPNYREPMTIEQELQELKELVADLTELVLMQGGN